MEVQEALALGFCIALKLSGEVFSLQLLFLSEFNSPTTVFFWLFWTFLMVALAL